MTCPVCKDGYGPGFQETPRVVFAATWYHFATHGRADAAVVHAVTAPAEGRLEASKTITQTREAEVLLTWKSTTVLAVDLKI
jgi:hypothetical protein